MPDQTAEIIALPVSRRPSDPLRETIWRLDRCMLLETAGTLVRLATEACERADDADFYDSTRAAYLCLERVLVETA